MPRLVYKPGLSGDVMGRGERTGRGRDRVGARRDV